MRRPASRGATTAQLKNAIDSGRTGDKTPGFDPAAAPLGTDAEAGGAEPSPGLIAEDLASETAGRASGGPAHAASPELTPDGVSRRPSPLRVTIMAIGLAVLAAVLLVVVLRPR
jgi:hypothetical protein